MGVTVISTIDPNALATTVKLVFDLRPTTNCLLSPSYSFIYTLATIPSSSKTAPKGRALLWVLVYLFKAATIE